MNTRDLEAKILRREALIRAERAALQDHRREAVVLGGDPQHTSGSLVGDDGVGPELGQTMTLAQIRAEICAVDDFFRTLLRC